ncbi:hypothetical protein FI667_g16238, partial [Globisporangium splendens]
MHAEGVATPSSESKPSSPTFSQSSSDFPTFDQSDLKKTPNRYNLPEQPTQAALSLGPTTPLLEIIDNGDAYVELQPPNTDAADIAPTIHSHVNRFLDRIANSVGVLEQLTSHSFRRGGAQHASGSADLTARWTFDRGAWNMSTTNKGFRYAFNTTKEITSVQDLLCTACKGLSTTGFNVNQRALDVLTAYLTRHYPLLKEINPEEPAIKRLETCVLESDCTAADLLSWSTHLVAIPSSCTEEETNPRKSSKQAPKVTEESSIIRHQASVIDHFIQHAKHQDSPRKEKRQHEEVPGDKQKKSDAELLVAFMKLFLEDGFALDSQAQSYRDLVLGSKAESSVLEFLRARGISLKGSNAVLNHLRVLHRSGALSDKITHHRKLLTACKILAPVPAFTQDILEDWLRCVASRAPLIVLISHFAASCNYIIINNNNNMKPPTKNNISSGAEFKGLCVMYANSAGVRIRDQALRHLRTTLNAASSHSNDLREALYVIFLSLAKRGTRMTELEHLREWVAPPADDTDASDDAEWSADGSLASEQLHSVREVLDCVREGTKTYYLVDWMPEYEPRENLPQSLIVQFNKEHRALVRRTYIEYEASKGNSENPQ